MFGLGRRILGEVYFDAGEILPVLIPPYTMFLSRKTFMTQQTTRRRPTRAYKSALASANMRIEPLEPRTFFSTTPAATPASLVAQANNAFAFDLFHQLGNTGNLFFSPYSIATALEMTLQGANGTTASEIIQALHLPSNEIAQAGIQALHQLFQAGPDAGYTLSTANRLWVQNNLPMLDSYLSRVQDIFGAGPQSVDFGDPQAAAATINAWVSDQTHGKIPNLISKNDIDSLTCLILTNAIYFKGDWASVFNATYTHDAFFQQSPTDTTKVRMMWQENYYDYYAQSGPNGFQALDIPYQGNNLDMLVILPTSTTLDAFQSALTPDLFSTITSNLHSADVSVSLPQFKLEGSFLLNTPLQNLGIHAAFNAADFSGMFPLNPDETYFIQKVIHKTFIQVTEKGTEAAAATAVIVGTTGCVTLNPPIPISFYADHPFLFAIRDHATNTILFLGRVTDPGYTPPTDTTTPPGSTGLLPGQPVPIGTTLPITTPNPTFPVKPTYITILPINAIPIIATTLRLAPKVTPRRALHVLGTSSRKAVARNLLASSLQH